MRRRRVHGYARCRHLTTVTNRRFARARVNAGRVSHAAVMQNFVAARGAAFDSILNIEGEDRRELFHRKRKVAAHAADIGNQAARPRGRADSCQFCDCFH